MVQTSAGLMATLGGLGLVDVLVHARSRFADAERLRWINFATLIVFGLATLASLALWAGGVALTIAMAIPIVAVTQHMARITATKLLADGLLRRFDLVRTLPIAVPLLLMVVVVPVHGANLSVVMLYTVAITAAAVPAFWRYHPGALGTSPGPIAPQLRRLSLQSTAWNLIQLSLARLDVVLVYLIVGRQEAGVYGAAVALAEACTFVSTGLSYHALRMGSAGGKQQGGMVGAIATGCLLLLVIGFVGEVAPSLLGDEFDGVARLLLVYAPAALSIALLRPMLSYRLGANALEGAVPLMLLGLGISVIGDIGLIPRYGAVAAAAVSSVAYSATYLVLRVRLHELPPAERP